MAMTGREAFLRGSLASPSCGLSERRWVDPSLSLAGLSPLQRSSGQRRILPERAPPVQASGDILHFLEMDNVPIFYTSLRSASARSVFSQVKAVKVSLFAMRLPPTVSFHE